jgi:magnesium-transporting ATPase (P-type)
MVDCFVYGEGWYSGAWSKVVEAIIIGVTIVVVAVPEGLPLAVTISLAYSVGRMRKENNLVRQLHACETMGSVNIICSDKTGTLTENRMEITHIDACGMQKEKVNFTKDLYDPNFTKLLCEGICENSSASISKNEKGVPVMVGNRTECALLLFSRTMDYDYIDYRKKDNFGNRIPFSSDIKRMTTAVRVEEGRYISYCKGASETLLDMCEYVQVNGESIEPLDEEKKENFVASIDHYASQSLRTLCLAYREMSDEDLEASQENPEILE